jgi:hypothetical protein
LPERNCDTCTIRQKERYGCTEDIKEFDFFGDKLKRCPRRPHLEMPLIIGEALKHFTWYRDGHLPSPGTWMDQTPAYQRFMEVLKVAVNIIEKERMDQATAKPRSTK